MHRAVDGVAGGIDLERAVHLLGAGQVDLDQAGGGDFMKHQAVGVDQEIIGARHLGGNMGEDQIVPAMQGDQPITGGQVDTGLPFGGADLGFDADSGGWSIHADHLAGCGSLQAGRARSLARESAAASRLGSQRTDPASHTNSGYWAASNGQSRCT